MSPPVVLVDIDETVFPFSQAYEEWLIRVRGYGFDRERFQDYDLAEAVGDAHVDLAVAFVNDPYVISTTRPRAAAIAALDRLAPSVTLIACTSRREVPEGEATRRWLSLHLPAIRQVAFTSEERGGPVLPKSQIARGLSAIALVDDSDEHLRDLPESCRGLLITRPGGLPQAPGAMDWHQAVDVIASLLR